MNPNQIYKNDFVSLEPIKHIYTDINGDTYESVSSLLKALEVPFDAETISMSMARAELGKNAPYQTVLQKQKAIKASWKRKADNSINHGNFIHDNLEKYWLTGNTDYPEINNLASNLYSDVFKSMHRIIPEKIYYDPKRKIAGSADISCIRKENRTKPWILDIFDYKTNAEQGITFDSIDRRKVPAKHYERYMIGNFEMIESCNYYKYSLQLSLYAFMAMNLYNARIGRLAIIFVDKNYQYQIIPVPFMYYEVLALLDQVLSVKPLPIVSTVKKEAAVEFDYYNDSEFEIEVGE
jgi:hypothetical protein